MKELPRGLTAGEWPVDLIPQPGTKESLVHFVFRSTLDDWSANVDQEVSAISARLHEAGVRRALQQSRALEDQLRAAFGSSQTLDQLSERVARLEAKIEQLIRKLDEADTREHSILIPIETLAPEPYDLLRSFTVAITGGNDEFEASLFDAGIFASGETEEDAVANLKDTLIDTYDRLNELGDDKLGPGPLRQKYVLNKLICKVENR